MAAYTASQNGNWDASATWGGAGVPGIDDSANLATFHVTANVAASCASLIGGASSELILTKNNFQCAGTMTLNNVAVTTAADMIGVILSATSILIGLGGSLTLSDDLAITGALILSGGDINTTASYWIALTGDLAYSAGTVTAFNVDHYGTSGLAWQATGARITNYTVMAGAVISMTDFADMTKLTVQSGGRITLASAKELRVAVLADNAINVVGSGIIDGAGHLKITFTANRANSGRLAYAGTGSVYVSATADATLTQSGEVNISGGTLAVGSKEATALATFKPTGVVTALGPVTLGTVTATNRRGALDVSGMTTTVNLTSLAIIAGYAQALNNVLILGSAKLRMSGTFDGTRIDVTSTGAEFGGAGSLTNVTMTSGIVYAPLSMKGANNDVTPPHYVVFMPGGGVLGRGTVGAMLGRRG